MSKNIWTRSNENLISFLFEILLKEQYFSFLRIIQAYDYLKFSIFGS